VGRTLIEAYNPVWDARTQVGDSGILRCPERVQGILSVADVHGLSRRCPWLRLMLCGGVGDERGDEVPKSHWQLGGLYITIITLEGWTNLFLVCFPIRVFHIGTIRGGLNNIFIVGCSEATLPDHAGYFPFPLGVRIKKYVCHQDLLGVTTRFYHPSCGTHAVGDLFPGTAYNISSNATVIIGNLHA
jgi:hypothetical protein